MKNMAKDPVYQIHINGRPPVATWPPTSKIKDIYFDTESKMQFKIGYIYIYNLTQTPQTYQSQYCH